MKFFARFSKMEVPYRVQYIQSVDRYRSRFVKINNAIHKQTLVATPDKEHLESKGQPSVSDILTTFPSFTSHYLFSFNFCNDWCLNLDMFIWKADWTRNQLPPPFIQTSMLQSTLLGSNSASPRGAHFSVRLTSHLVHPPMLRATQMHGRQRRRKRRKRWLMWVKRRRSASKAGSCPFPKCGERWTKGEDVGCYK